MRPDDMPFNLEGSLPSGNGVFNRKEVLRGNLSEAL